ncbi:MAG: hypothetical protein ABIP06_06120 [Pyrinomonadaceae bacterium]
MSSLLKIKFVGKTEPAPEFLTDGRSKIVLPKNQNRPFAHKESARICRLFPELYKPVVPKGK